MDVKALLTDIKNIVARFKAEATEAAPAVETVPAAQTTESPATETTAVESEPATETSVQLAEETKTEGAPDYAAMQAEIADLRKKVAIMDEYTYMKEAFESLKSRVEQMQAGFSSVIEVMDKTTAAVEFMADQPTGVPAQTPKDTYFGKKNKAAIEKYFNV